jgi:hypothetical protein
LKKKFYDCYLNGVTDEFDPGVFVGGLEQPEAIHVGAVGLRIVGGLDHP